MILFEMGYSRGFHVWQLEWPQRQRGTHAVVGVATKAAALHAVGYTSLIGTNCESYGWDLSRIFQLADIYLHHIISRAITCILLIMIR